MDCSHFLNFIRVCAFIIPSISLQSWVFSSPYWVKHNNTSECFLGVTKNHGCPDNVEGKRNTTSKIFKISKHFFFNFVWLILFTTEGLGYTIGLLQLISLVIVVLAAISTMAYNDDDGFADDDISGDFCSRFCSSIIAFGQLMYRLYFISGMISFIKFY